MIVKLLFEMVLTLLDLLFSWVNFPDMPSQITTYVDIAFNAIESGLGFVWCIVDKRLVVALLPIVLVVENFDKVYSVVMWIVKRIPFIGIG